MDRTGHPRRDILILALAGVALLACYAPVLRGMAGQWWSDEDMGHGFVVPIVALWIAWRERARWRALAPEPNWWGFAILAAGAGMQGASALGAGLFAGSVAFLVSLAGVVVAFGGFAYLRAFAFPLLVALFMLPKLAVVYNQATLPLQLLASRLAQTVLVTAGMAVLREGNILELGQRRVAVVEACSGIRYLLSLGFMAVVYAYLADSKPWMRVALLVATIPLAVGANAARVAAAVASPALAEGAWHAIAGWIVFVLCLAALAALQRLFNSIYARFQT